jgi:AcrR family transcriptional regulator
VPRPLSDAARERFREEICVAATGLFAERGLGGVTMRGIADAVGCSPMTPYRYFAGKDALFETVRIAAFRRFGLRVQAAARRHADPLDRLRAMCRVYVAFALDEPHSYRVMFQLEQVPIPDNPEHLPAVHGAWGPLLDTMREGVATGRLAGDPETLAHVCWFMVHGAVTLHLAGKLLFARSLEQVLEPMLDVFLGGAGAAAGAAGPRA